MYLDLAVLLNFLVDFFLLTAAARLSGFSPAPGRTLAAAGLGGLYSGLCLLPALSFLASPLWRSVSLCAMVAAAYGCSRSGLRRGAVFLLLSLSMAGIAMGFHRARFGLLLLEAVLLALLCRVAFGDRIGGREYVTVTIGGESGPMTLTALVDTGNCLRDPVTGEPVLVVSGDRAPALAGLTPDQLRHPMQTLCAHPLPGLRLIPYRAVGVGGMLLARRFSSVRIGGRETRALVAFAPEGLGEGSIYEALIGGIL